MDQEKSLTPIPDISNIPAVRAGDAAWAMNLVIFSIGGNSNYVSIVARKKKLLA